MTQLCAKDVMAVDVVTVPPAMRATDLARLFVDRAVSTVAVIAPTGVLQGIVTESDLIRRLADEDEQPRKGWLAALLETPNAQAIRYSRSHAATAGELMTTEVIAVQPSASASHIARLMEEHNIRRVLVTEQGRLLGLVSRTDLVRTLVSPLSEPVGESDEDVRRGVLEAMKREAWASTLNTAVSVRNGVVEFSGFYHSEPTRHALRVLAENVPGVTKVVDSMVAPPPMFAG
jgi:CBS domain-containing protein